jgi:hypothetical protein
MKRDGDIASLFRKHAAKRQNVNPMPPPEATQEQERVIEENVNPMPPPPPPHPEATQEQEEERVIEEIVNPTPPPPPPPLPPSAPPTYDVSRLPNDPGERQPIASFHANNHDAI